MTGDATELRGFSEALRKTPAIALGAASKALNAGALEAERLGRAHVLSELNLDAPYVHKHLAINTKAKRTDLQSRIRANNRATLAPRFGAAVATTTARSARSRLKGDAYRNIAPGRTAAGSTPWKVKRSGTARAWGNAFFVRLKTSGAWAMVARQGDGNSWRKGGDLKVITGVTVGQVWRASMLDIAPLAMEAANRVFTEELARRLP